MDLNNIFVSFNLHDTLSFGKYKNLTLDQLIKKLEKEKKNPDKKSKDYKTVEEIGINDVGDSYKIQVDTYIDWCIKNIGWFIIKKETLLQINKRHKKFSLSNSSLKILKKKLDLIDNLKIEYNDEDCIHLRDEGGYLFMVYNSYSNLYWDLKNNFGFPEYYKKDEYGDYYKCLSCKDCGCGTCKPEEYLPWNGS